MLTVKPVVLEKFEFGNRDLNYWLDFWHFRPVKIRTQRAKFTNFLSKKPLQEKNCRLKPCWQIEPCSFWRNVSLYIQQNQNLLGFCGITDWSVRAESIYVLFCYFWFLRNQFSGKNCQLKQGKNICFFFRIFSKGG